VASVWQPVGKITVMNNYEAASFIEEKIPKAHIFEKSGRLTFDINKTICCLTQFLKKRFLMQDMASVKKVLRIADTIYNKGDYTVKAAIENILVFSISAIMPDEKRRRRELQSKIPSTLFHLYIHQIMHSNI
jgi:hypothetical protein